MTNDRIYIDIARTEYDNGLIYHIEGWTSIIPLEIESFRLIADNEEVSFKLTLKRRLDVKKDFPGLIKSEKPGFAIFIENFKEVMYGHESLKLSIISRGKETVVLEKSLEELRLNEKNAVIRFNIDKMGFKDDELRISGWAGRTGEKKPVECRIYNGKGEEVDFEIERSIRTDLNKVLKLSGSKPEAAFGFEIKIKKQQCTTRVFHLVFGDENSDKIFTIPVRRILSKNSKIHRLKSALREREDNKKFIQDHGFSAFLSYFRCKVNSSNPEYNLWFKMNSAGKKALKEQTQKEWDYEPLISIIIPLYNTPRDFLKEMLDSLLAQTYAKFELCLADGSNIQDVGEFIKNKYSADIRIKYKKLAKNGGISDNTNAALKMAKGDYIMLADHDDIVEPDALYEIVRMINNGRPDIIYTDEDKVSFDGRDFLEPRFKPDFNLDLLRSVNYICHIFVVKKSIADLTGGFRHEYDGAQDYDFILRCVEQTNNIAHVPKVLYHWRAHSASTAENPESKKYAFEAGRRAVQESYNRLGINAKVELTDYFGIYRTQYEIKNHPLVSVLILNKDHADDLRKCINSIKEKTTYDNWEIIIAENNSENKDTFDYYKEITSKDKRIRVVEWNGEFNYSAINNYAADNASGEYYLLLNNDIEVISDNWIEQMLGYCQREDVGAAGAKLYYPDNTIQHSGVVLGIGGVAGHVLCKEDGSEAGYNGRLVTAQDISAVTAACMLVKASVYREVGGLDESFKVAFNDVDFCMKIRKAGYLIVFTPYAELYHYESKSRGDEDTPEKQLRFAGEIERFQKKWSNELESGDPYYNPNLTLSDCYCSLRWGEQGENRKIIKQ